MLRRYLIYALLFALEFAVFVAVVPEPPAPVACKAGERC